MDQRTEEDRLPVFETQLRQWIKRVPWRTLARWWIVGLAFTGGGLVVLYVLRDVLRLPLVVATAAGAEVTLLLRFVINDRWVFGNRHPSWTRLWQFHVAGGAGGAIWWVVANLLPRFGVHYLVAAIVGSACSVMFSMATNFLWIWRRRVRFATADRVGSFDAK
jgi:putative flippase GtrA